MLHVTNLLLGKHYLNKGGIVLKNKLTTRFLVSAFTAATLLLSSAGTVEAAGGEVVDFSIVQERKSYDDTLDGGKKENLTGKTVIISTNDVHGAITDFAYVAGLKNKMEERGASVILVDSGDFSTDKPEIQYYDSKSDDAKESTDKSKGIAAVKIMNAVGYDYACLGNHEFERRKDALDNIINAADFTFVDANINGLTGDKVQAYAITDSSKSPVKIGFFGLLTPESGNWYDRCGYSVDPTELHSTASETANKLAAEGAEVIITLAHLGVENDILKNQKGFVFDRDENGKKIYDKVYANGTRSVDLFAFTGEDDGVHKIDLILDGHSHTTMSDINQKKYPGCHVQSQGIQLQNIGVTVIDNDTKEITDRYLISEEYYSQIGKDPKIEAYIDDVIESVQKGKTIPDYNADDYAESTTTTDDATVDTAEDTTDATVDDTADTTVDDTTDTTVEDTTDTTVEDTTVDTVDDTTGDSTDDASENTSGDSSGNPGHGGGHHNHHHNNHHRYGHRAA
jgi:2',3'-cyclic-nucleotide 2'-phosphodiesterase (5'-nucleotidase family)